MCLMFMCLRRVLFVAFLTLISGAAFSEGNALKTETSPVVTTPVEDSQAVQNWQGTSEKADSSTDNANCWVQAANKYGLDAWLLYTIAVKESSLNPRAVNRNSDGSEDRGLMQINSQHYPRLAAMGIKADDLWEPCLNIHVGAWILATSVQVFGPTWNAVGGYNAGTNKKSPVQENKRFRYASDVERLYYRLQHSASK